MLITILWAESEKFSGCFECCSLRYFDESKIYFGIILWVISLKCGYTVYSMFKCGYFYRLGNSFLFANLNFKSLRLFCKEIVILDFLGDIYDFDASYATQYIIAVYFII